MTSLHDRKLQGGERREREREGGRERGRKKREGGREEVHLRCVPTSFSSFHSNVVFNHYLVSKPVPEK